MDIQELPQRRREIRFPVAGIEGSLQTPGDVRVVNVSRHGIAFEVPLALAVGQDCFLELRYRGQVTHVAARLRWCERLTGDEPVSRAGGPFVETLTSPVGVWKSLLPDLRPPTAEIPS